MGQPTAALSLPLDYDILVITASQLHTYIYLYIHILIIYIPVLHNPVVTSTTGSAIANNKYTMVESRTAAGAAIEDSTGIELEGIRRCINGHTVRNSGTPH